jgi:hypothetical protein
MKELEDEARAKYEAYTDSVNQDRCESVDDGVRCQLFIHDDDQHAALIFDEIDERTARRARIQARKAEYKTWGEPWTKARPGEGLLPWAGDFPRAESNPWRPPQPGRNCSRGSVSMAAIGSRRPTVARTGRSLDRPTPTRTPCPSRERDPVTDRDASTVTG